MAITPLPTPPSRQDPANFNVRADEFLGALPTFGTEANSLASDVNSKQVTASNAATTATNAASTATTKAGEAEASAQAANTAKLAAEAAFDSFDDRYLGQKTGNPTTDNDGNPLIVGALYFRTTAPVGMKVWTGTAWDDAYANLSSKFDKTGGVISGGISVAGNVLATSGALGYGVGAGGTVVQATSKSAGVTLNKPSGRITTNNAALGAGASVIFILMNSTIAITDEVSVTMISGGNYRVEPIDIFNGGVTFRVTNISASSLSDALAFNFKVFKVSLS